MKEKWYQYGNKRWLIGLLGFMIAALLIGRSDFSQIDQRQEFIVEHARVLTVLENLTWEDAYIPDLSVGSQMVEIEILSGNFSGETLVMEHALGRFHNLELTDGMRVMVSMWPGASELSPYDISVYGPERGHTFGIIMALLIAGILLVGRSKGFYAIISLAFTFVVIVFYLVHGIILGGSPIILSILSSLLIISFATGMISGATKEMIASVAGALTGLLVAGIASFFIGRATHITGIHLEGVRHVLYHTPPGAVIRIQDLFFAVVIIATTGAMIDSSVSLASTAFEMKAQGRDKNWRELYQQTMEVGKSVLGANINTLILAFAGTSLVTILLIVLFGFSPTRIINLELVAIEIILGASATIGMLAGIPATVFFSAKLACWQPNRKNRRKGAKK